MISHRKCPFCGGRNLEFVTDYMVGYVSCDCGARGSVVRVGSGATSGVTAEEYARPAWEAWNDRRCASLVTEQNTLGNEVVSRSEEGKDHDAN